MSSEAHRCFELMRMSRFLALPARDRYAVVHCCAEDCLRPQQTGATAAGVNSLLLVPRRFPCAIRLQSPVPLDASSLARLDAQLRRLNVCRRFKLVRSTIPSKSLSRSVARSSRQLLGTGTLRVCSHCLLTGELRVDDCRRFGLTKRTTGSRVQQAVVNYDGRSDCDTSICLETGCTLLSFELSIAGAKKTASGVFFSPDRRTMRAGGLMCCLVNLKSGLLLKLYFDVCRRQTDASKTPIISKILVVANCSLTRAAATDPAATFATAIQTSRLDQTSGNYRFNVDRCTAMPRSSWMPTARLHRQQRKSSSAATRFTSTSCSSVPETTASLRTCSLSSASHRHQPTARQADDWRGVSGRTDCLQPRTTGACDRRMLISKN